MRLKIVFSYDGSSFFGYAKQVDKKTIQGEIERVLKIIFQEDITLNASGRTDKGVHALSQVAHFDVRDREIDLEKIRYSFNKLIDEAIYLKSIEKVDSSFHARFSSREKTYLYVINYEKYDVVLRNYELFDCYIDINKLIEASKLFIGKHNFMDFCSKDNDEDNFIRTIKDIKIEIKGSRILLYFVGDGFMRYQIRKIVGTLIEISKGKIESDFIKNHLDQKNRNIVSYQADPKGLYLVEVKYENYSFFD